VRSEFTFSAEDQEYHASRGFTNEPKRCPTCREAAPGRGWRSWWWCGGYGSRQMYPAVCADCGQQTEVPFQPRGDRPVYCRDCFAKPFADTQPLVGRRASPHVRGPQAGGSKKRKSRIRRGCLCVCELREGESQERLLTRFRQAVQKDGILREAKRKRHFVSKSEARRLARAKSLRRARKRAEGRARPSNGRRPA